MAGNYANLLATIASNVYTNHNNEVTAAQVKAALDGIVSSLTAGGYLWKGIATPTSPGSAQTPDERVFYLATTAGTYTYLGGLVVNAGEAAILYWDTAWHKVNTGIPLVSVSQNTQTGVTLGNVNVGGTDHLIKAEVKDTTPTQNSSHPITSGAVYNLDQTIYNRLKPELTQEIEDAVSQIQPIVIEGDVTNAPDEEDLTSVNQGGTDVLKFRDRPYAALSGNGMGYKILRKSASFASQVTAANTIYEIRYDFTLDADFTMPSNCVLKFNGGSIGGAYTLTGDNTKIDADNVGIFDGVTIAGNWDVPNIYSGWFADCTSLNVIKNLVALSNENITNNIYIAAGSYSVSVANSSAPALALKSNTNFYCDGTITMSTNAFRGYQIIFIGDARNVRVVGGTYIGDKDTHTGVDGEFGHGISIVHSTDIIIENVEVKKCWGDCVYIASDNVIIKNFNLSEGRRQGISVVDGDNITIENGTIKDIAGTDPQSCIDIEPNDGEEISNIVIKNVVLKNSADFLLYVAGKVGDIYGVTIEQCSFFPTTSGGIYLSAFDGVTNIKDCRFVVPDGVSITGPAIRNAVRTGHENDQRYTYISGCSFNMASGYVLNNYDGFGHVSIKNCDISVTALCFISNKDMLVENCNIQCSTLTHSSFDFLGIMRNNIFIGDLAIPSNKRIMGGSSFVGNRIVGNVGLYGNDDEYVDFLNNVVVNSGTNLSVVFSRINDIIGNRFELGKKIQVAYANNFNDNSVIGNFDLESEELDTELLESSSEGLFIRNNRFVGQTGSTYGAVKISSNNNHVIGNYFNVGNGPAINIAAGTTGSAIVNNFGVDKETIKGGIITSGLISKPIDVNVGPTAVRPTHSSSQRSYIGLQFFDTSLESGNGKPIWWNGTNWVDATGTPV